VEPLNLERIDKRGGHCPALAPDNLPRPRRKSPQPLRATRPTSQLTLM
jgi:hypothetical protein